ncbi:cytosolic endo-beta-N-acetylglucosaminidase isoform X1 [Neodiprion lecontei]|uniref:Cytosolic endo-beta-N-acetylglucosaminidase n=1 Tax=Neodiprion lecontei TaxID=441921 RepID=A0A6J0B8S3_NEOLC|nr:cytosolic endo-beta-N-acetylglucosaminidase isoform X1 [Neodiprion lecontei]
MSSKAENETSQVLTSKPFKTLEELYAGLSNLTPWPEIRDVRKSADYVYSGKDINDVTKPLVKWNRNKKPRTLVCHDMKGGYLDDRFIFGSDAHDSYVFYHWSGVDSFVYFSHYLVTIPPYGWINAAHTHGVKVLGTVITEWTDGERIWKEIFRSEAEIKRFADALITLAKFYKFDGWLINVENKIDEDDIDKLIFFVKYLTNTIHTALEGSEVIWYDSVTVKGELKWQNELNDLNKCFFEVCDGIFLNYNWTDTGLASSRNQAIAGNRVRDIYVGLDVWGRGCPGGGGFQSEYALRKIREHHLSVAIFAPGWTHEYLGPKTFIDTENLFWAQLFPYLYIHVPLYDNETFRTSLCLGVGLTNYRLGQSAKYSEDKPFFNLSVQSPQVSTPSPHLEILNQPEITEPKVVTESNLLNKNETESASGQVLTTESDLKKVVEDIVYDTKRSCVKVHGQSIAFTSTTLNSELNYFKYCRSCSFNGGGCLEIITSNPRLFHRLFLIQVTSSHGIQVSIVYSMENCAQDQCELMLVAGDDGNLKLISKYQTEELDYPWKKNLYITNFERITEIGVAASKEGRITLGEIVVQDKQPGYRDNQDLGTLISDVNY